MKRSFKVPKRGRTYNAFVTNESLEDYSLRYAAKSFRKWTGWILANTALGGISFLALEAIGALLIVNYGFGNAVSAIVVVSMIIFATGLPITYYSAKYNVDIDLLTRGAGFGYIGSTITSLIYASFTFIFFAIEASIMAEAIKMYWGVPLSIGYIICSIIIIPLVFFGITLINRIQLYTQVIWLVLMILPYAFILNKNPEVLSQWINFSPEASVGSGFNPILFGAAMTITFSLIAQIGEQVDYLRFMPDKTPANARIWWLTVVLGGPGWIIIGMFKLLAGTFLASLAIGHGMHISEAIQPVYMYLTAYKYVFSNPKIVLLVTTIFVLISQIKINITNAYAGSLAWSNFFSRVTHSHAGRVVWLIFNVMIALLVMQFGLTFTLESIIGLYANMAVAWIAAIFADLVVLKPLRISPPYNEFKRGYIYNFNPVGLGAMTLASGVSILSYFGTFGPWMKAYSGPISFFISFITAIAIGFITKGRYYIAREKDHISREDTSSLIDCAVCDKSYEYRDMVFCSMYNEWVCSLCCSLEIRCKDNCKKKRLATPSSDLTFNEAISSLPSWDFNKPLKRFLLYFSCIVLLIGSIFLIFYFHSVVDGFPDSAYLSGILVKIFLFVVAVLGILLWWLSLSKEHTQLIEDELDLYIFGLEKEINEHLKTEETLKIEKLRTEKELTTRQQMSEALDQALRQQRQALRQQKLILDNTSVGIGFIRENKLFWCNKRFLDLTGFNEGTKKELKRLLLSSNKEGELADIFHEFGFNSVSNIPVNIELEVNCEDTGKKMSLSLVGSPLDPKDFNEGIIWLLDDITERKDMLDKLRESQERLKELNEKLEEKVAERTKELERTYQSLRQADKMASLGILVSGIAHEINNPLGFIRPNCKILQETFKDIVQILENYKGDYDGLTIAGIDYEMAMKSIPKMLKGILEGTERIGAIVSNLKGYSKQMPLEMESAVDINEALNTSLSLLSSSIKRSNNRFMVKKGKHLPSFKGDIRGIEQVIINVIQNAFQAVETNQERIWVSTFAYDEYVVLKVEDKGVGISMEELQHIRDPFFTTKRDQGGTGLGLFVSERIVGEHHGIMEIESAPGNGTVVTLRFPAIH